MLILGIITFYVGLLMWSTRRWLDSETSECQWMEYCSISLGFILWSIFYLE